MAVTPQSNASLADIAAALLACDSVAVCGHVNPDGDCIGSELALAHALRNAGKRVVCLLAKDDPLGPALSSLPGADELVSADGCDEVFDGFVAVDVPTLDRLGDAAAVHQRALRTFTVDHHAVPERMSDLSYTDADAAATSMLVWELSSHLGSPRSADVASCAYAGLMTDTGRFQYQSVTPEVFECAAEMTQAGADPSEIAKQFYQNRRLASLKLEGIAVSRMHVLAEGKIVLSWITAEDRAACGAEKGDSESVIDALRSIEGVVVACVLKEQEGSVRGSLRAKDDTDVASIAQEFGGGGHRAAAGFTFEGDIESAVAALEARLLRLFGDGEAR